MIYLFSVKTPRPHQQKLCSKDLTPVSEAFEHAIFARYSRPRYIVGKKMTQVQARSYELYFIRIYMMNIWVHRF